MIKSFIKILFMSFFISLGVTKVGLALTPTQPSNPYSDESFQLIKNYYLVNNQLPGFRVISNTQESFSTYKLQIVKLSVNQYPDVVFVLKMPLLISKPLPAVVLFSGFQTGAQAVQLVDDPKSVIYVGFEYPWPFNFSKQNAAWDWKRMESVPILMALTVLWLRQQAFIDQQKISIINVSFGNLFYPLAQRLLNEQGVFPKAIVFGYGGVEISEVIGHFLESKIGPWELALTKTLIQSQSWIFEPKFHLAHLNGPFLVVNGANDDVFPALSQQKLITGLPQQPQIVTIPGGHIQPDRPDLIRQFMNEVMGFLQKSDAL